MKTILVLQFFGLALMFVSFMALGSYIPMKYQHLHTIAVPFVGLGFGFNLHSIFSEWKRA